ncbi:WD repeat-containing protein 26 [Xylographa soralifera]|nr:WD repeat-containing protein 26 [Xylographa soralifera]
MASPNPTPISSLPTSDTALDTSLDADPDIDMNIAPGPIEQTDADDGHLDFGADGVKDEDFDMEKMNGNGNGIQEGAGTDVRVPLKKDISLREFLGRMDEYAPIVSLLAHISPQPSHPPPTKRLQIPDAVTAHALTLAGLPPPPPPSSQPPSDPPNPLSTNAPLPASSSTTLPPHTPLHLSRLLALATQKFIADIAADAYQYSRMRSGNVTSNSLAAQAGAAPGAPGAAAPVAGASGAAAIGGGGAGVGGGGVGGGGGGNLGKGGEKGTGQHVLGMQRPGFGGGGQGGGQGRTVLTMEDLGMAVGEYGVSVRRGEFYR